MIIFESYVTINFESLKLSLKVLLFILNSCPWNFEQTKIHRRLSTFDLSYD